MNKKILIIATPILMASLYFFLIDGSKREVTAVTNRTSSELSTNKTSTALEESTFSMVDSTIKSTDDLDSKKSIEEDDALEKELNTLSKKKINSKDKLLQKETKKVMADINERILQEMTAIPNCLESAKTKEDAFECTNKLRVMQQEQSLLRGDEEIFELKAYGDDFVWNEERKEMMIKGIQESIAEVSYTNECIEKYTKGKELRDCLGLYE